MNAEFVEFKTIKLNTLLDTGSGAELELSQEGRVSVDRPEGWEGYAVVYLNIKIGDDGGHFLFDIITQTVIKLPEGVSELSDELNEECILIAREKTYAAIRAISVGMGISELDLGGE